MSKLIADTIFPNVKYTYNDYERKYPPRIGPAASTTTRFAPSPTGFMHIGGLYTALINYLLAKQNHGIIFLRIEDTDQKRQIENGVSEIIQTLRDFSIKFDEGPFSETDEHGIYGPYQQSQRRDIYQSYAKYLLEQDLAYPCFCTEEDRIIMRERQEQDGAVWKGYYGKWAKCRNLTDKEILTKIENGISYVIRLRSPGIEGNIQKCCDVLRGNLSMQENIMDVVLIKKDGLPTYHFAHVIDDHLMHTTDVIRADEWIASMPLHIQLFRLLGFPVPRYAHLSPITKQELKADGITYSFRKLSKRKDPEARVHYYDEVGYPIQAVLDYLLTIASSQYEPWRKENPDSPITSFPFSLANTGISGSLFDVSKLNSISRNRISHMDCDLVFDLIRKWASRYEPALERIIRVSPKYFRNTIPLWHENRLDVEKWSDLLIRYPYLYKSDYRIDEIPFPEQFASHSQIIPSIVKDYLVSFNYSDSAEQWFNKLRTIAIKYNYSAKTSDHKKHPNLYNGSISDVASFIRFGITGCLNTPDLYRIIQVIGEEKTRSQLISFYERSKTYDYSK